MRAIQHKAANMSCKKRGKDSGMGWREKKPEGGGGALDNSPPMKSFPQPAAIVSKIEGKIRKHMHPPRQIGADKQKYANNIKNESYGNHEMSMEL